MFTTKVLKECYPHPLLKLVGLQDIWFALLGNTSPQRWKSYHLTEDWLYLLTCYIPNSDVLSFVVDSIEDFMGLQAEGRDGKKNEEEWAKCHIL